MKVFVCLFAVIACASASAIVSPLLSTGTSSSSRTQDAAGNYAFAYNEQHATGGSSRKESGAPGVATGSYSLNVADGRQRVVKYVADALGFRAAIATNEPGTAAQPAAATSISSPYLPPQQVAPIAVAAPVAVAAPIAVAAAPLAVANYATVGHAVAAVPAISSYSTSVNHAAPALAVAHAPALAVAHAPALAYNNLGLGLGLKGLAAY